MEKSNHKYLGSIIPYEELKNFIEPISLNYPIPFSDLKQISKDITQIEVFFDNLCPKVLKYIPTLSSELNNKYFKIFSMTYTSHIAGYDFRINPIDLFNNIFKYLKLSYSIPYINLDNTDGMSYLKDYVRSYIKDIKRITIDSKIISIMDEIDTNLDKLCSIYSLKLDDYIGYYLEPKDVIFYLAYTSLINFEQTNDSKYMILPCEYYYNVSHMQTSQFPHSMNFETKYTKKWFMDFRTEYEDKIGLDYESEANKFLITNSEVYLAWDILSPGMVNRELRDVVQRARSNPNVDYQKYQRLFEMKMNYYINSDYVKYIMGKYGLSGYVGFTYPNEYLVFDKFHNSETKNPSKKTILTHGEAIYALPSDRFSILRGDKQLVLEERKFDDRIKKINHNVTFINRLDPVVHGPNVSTSTFDEEFKKSKILIKK